MSKTLHTFCTLVIVLSYSCQHANPFKKENTAITIDMQPFSDISLAESKYVFNEIKKIYSNVTLKNVIPLPQSAFYPLRNRYRADSLINFLSLHTPAEHVTIGLTTKDISTSKDTIADWGVMGLGFCPGKACIASSFRLSKAEKLQQLFKVAIHELGHTQGLPHCEVRTCFMRDAEGHNTTNEEKDFCPHCKKFLEKKGWVFTAAVQEK